MALKIVSADERLSAAHSKTTIVLILETRAEISGGSVTLFTALNKDTQALHTRSFASMRRKHKAFPTKPPQLSAPRRLASCCLASPPHPIFISAGCASTSAAAGR